MIDFNVVSRDPVVEELRREDHFVSVVPVCRLVSLVKVCKFSAVLEPNSSQNQNSEHKPSEHPCVVERTIGRSQKSRENRSEGPVHRVSHHKHSIEKPDVLGERVRTVFSDSQSSLAEYISDHA